MLVRKIIIAAAVSLLLAALPAAGAIYYEAVTSVDGKDQQQVRAWVEGPKSRVEITSGKKRDLLAPGSYLLTTDGGETLYLVNPDDKTYQVWDLDALFATFGAVMEGMEGVVSIDFTDLSSEKISQESGGSILGYGTQHVKWKSGYTMEMKILGMKRGQTVEMVQDSWVTPGLTDAGFAAWLRKDRFKTGNEGFDQLMEQEMEKVNGFPLKSVVQTTTQNKKGKGRTTTTTTEVKVLREEPVEAGIFELPEGYERIDLMPQG
jgi:hypothetical protein